MTKKRTYGAETKRRNITITDADYELLKQVGSGNASRGIRELAKMHRGEK